MILEQKLNCKIQKHELREEFCILFCLNFDTLLTELSVFPWSQLELHGEFFIVQSHSFCKSFALTSESFIDSKHKLIILCIRRLNSSSHKIVVATGKSKQ